MGLPGHYHEGLTDRRRPSPERAALSGGPRGKWCFACLPFRLAGECIYSVAAAAAAAAIPLLRPESSFFSLPTWTEDGQHTRNAEGQSSTPGWEC